MDTAFTSFGARGALLRRLHTTPNPTKPCKNKSATHLNPLQKRVTPPATLTEPGISFGVTSERSAFYLAGFYLALHRPGGIVVLHDAMGSGFKV